MSSTYIIPLSPAARFLATQLSSATSKPHIVLPPHLMKPFMTAESKITYINKISPSNQFNRTHSFPCSSLKFLERISRPVDVFSNPIATNPKPVSSTHPISMVIPASQITTVLDPLHQESLLTLPPNSNLVILNPYYGQIEKFMKRISSKYNIFERPKVWSAISTHHLTNSTLWSIEHRSIGELKVTLVPYEDIEQSVDISHIINDCKVVKDILNTPSVLPQLESYTQSNLLLIDQLITDAALSPLMLDQYKDALENDISDVEYNEDLKFLISRIIDEAVDVISYDPLFNRLLSQSPSFNSLLSSKRIFNKVMNILQNKHLMSLHSNLDYKGDLLKMRKRNEYEYNSIMKGNKISKISRMRDPTKANRQIVKLGHQLNIKTPANYRVAHLLAPKYHDAQKEQEDHNES